MYTIYKNKLKKVPGISVVKNLPCNAEDTVFVSGRRTKVPHATENLSSGAAMTETAWLQGKILNDVMKVPLATKT